MGAPKAPKPTPQYTDMTETLNRTDTSNPWGPAAGALQGMVDSAVGAYGATPKTPTFVGPNNLQLQGVDMLKQAAPWTAAGVPAMADLAGKTAGGWYLNPGNNVGMQGSGYRESINPGLQAMIQAAINPLRDQLDSNVLSIGDAAKLAGAYGGDRQELLKGTALSRFNRDAMDVGSEYTFNAQEAMQQRMFQASQADFAARQAAFENERQRQMNAGTLFGQTNELALKPAEIITALGDQQMGWDQAANVAKLDAPWAGLDRLTSVLGSVSPYGTQTSTGTNTTKGTVTRSTVKQPGGGLGGAFSGALGGASAGSAFGPWGAAAGGILGGLGGLFG